MTMAAGLNAAATEGTSNAITISTNDDSQVTFTQTVTSGDIPTGLADQTYTVLLNDRFLRLTSGQKISTQPNSRVAAYSQSKSGTVGTGSQIVLDIARNTLDPTVWTQFGDYGSNGQQIKIFQK